MSKSAGGLYDAGRITIDGGLSMKLPVACLALAVCLFASPSAPGMSLFNNAPPLFPTESQAQRHCPSDAVVWLNLTTGTYYFKGHRLYAKTKNGDYACRQEAAQAGDRPTHDE